MIDAIVPRTELRDTLARLFDYASGPAVRPGEPVIHRKGTLTGG